MQPNPTRPDDQRLTENPGPDAGDARVGPGQPGVESVHAGEAPETDAGPPRSGDKAVRAPERRCIATMETKLQGEMIRFVLSPDAVVTPDIEGKLPGRGAWVTAQREILETAVKKGAFSRAFKSPAKTGPDLVGQVEGLLARRLLDLLGLARGAGQVIAGNEQVRDALKSEPVACLIEASDGAEDGREKLAALAAGIARGRGQESREMPVIGCFSGDELGMALGRGRVIHACLKQGPFARNWIGEAGRLAGFRPIRPPAWTSGARHAGRGEAGEDARGRVTGAESGTDE